MPSFLRSFVAPTWSLVALLCSFVATPSTAQVKLTEGKIFYEIKYPNLPDSLRSREPMLPHNIVFYFKNEKSRVEMPAGPFGKNVTISDTIKKENTLLVTPYEKKFAIIKSDSEVNAFKMMLDPAMAKTTVKLQPTTETKKIAGYTCMKVIVTRTRNGIDNKSECWYSKELPAYNSMADEAMKQLDGLLMQYTATEGGITRSVTVSMVMPVPVDAKLFEIPPGYRVVTDQQLMAILELMQINESGR